MTDSAPSSFLVLLPRFPIRGHRDCVSPCLGEDLRRVVPHPEGLSPTSAVIDRHHLLALQHRHPQHIRNVGDDGIVEVGERPASFTSTGGRVSHTFFPSTRTLSVPSSLRSI